MSDARRQEPSYLAFPTLRSPRGRGRGTPLLAERPEAARGALASLSPALVRASTASPAQRLAAYLRAIDR